MSKGLSPGTYDAALDVMLNILREVEDDTAKKMLAIIWNQALGPNDPVEYESMCDEMLYDPVSDGIEDPSSCIHLLARLMKQNHRDFDETHPQHISYDSIYKRLGWLDTGGRHTTGEMTIQESLERLFMEKLNDPALTADRSIWVNFLRDAVDGRTAIVQSPPFPPKSSQNCSVTVETNPFRAYRTCQTAPDADDIGRRLLDAMLNHASHKRDHETWYNSRTSPVEEKIRVIVRAMLYPSGATEMHHGVRYDASTRSPRGRFHTTPWVSPEWGRKLPETTQRARGSHWRTPWVQSQYDGRRHKSATQLIRDALELHKRQMH